MRLRARAIPASLLAPLALVLLAFELLLGGCATPPPASDPEAVADFKATNDPLEPTNRFFYRVNDGALTYVLAPAARSYNAAVPRPVRGGIHNLLNNIGQPVQFVNDVLETKPRRAGDTFMRFAINTTLGVGGIFDVARRIGYADHDADGGLTLAIWGVPAGPYLYLPLYGPSGLRDGVGRGLDAAASPFTWLSFDGSNSLGWSQLVLGALDQTSRHLKDIQQVKADALDPWQSANLDEMRRPVAAAPRQPGAGDTRRSSRHGAGLVCRCGTERRGQAGKHAAADAAPAADAGDACECAALSGA